MQSQRAINIEMCTFLAMSIESLTKTFDNDLIKISNMLGMYLATNMIIKDQIQCLELILPLAYYPLMVKQGLALNFKIVMSIEYLSGLYYLRQKKLELVSISVAFQ